MSKASRNPEHVLAGTPVAPSVMTVHDALRTNAPVTSATIQALTGLPRRTVYSALNVLRNLDLLGERPSLRDARQSHMWLKAFPPQPSPAPVKEVEA